MYPVMLDLRDRPCLVAGGGPVALRKVEGLLSEGARVRLVAPEAVAALVALAAAGALVWEQRAFSDADADGQVLVFAATGDSAANDRIARAARERGAWVNVADEPAHCTFHLPGRIRRGGLQLALGSGGAAPFAVRRLREVLEQRFGDEWGDWLVAAERFRARVRVAALSEESEQAAFDAFFSGTVDATGLRARIPSADEEEDFLAPVSKQIQRRIGFVSLVGAGPGDPGLLTLRARQRLLEADHVVVDRLALSALPADLPPSTRIHHVGKEAEHHPVPQDEINALLLSLARQGARVVRLKGGDPFVFGRGSEEALALARAGIPFEVVPGVSAALAVPAAAGIPLTHRGLASTATILTAHEANKEQADGSQVRWDLLGADPAHTLLGFMGVAKMDAVANRLIAAGLDFATPAAVIERGTTARQRVLRSDLGRLAGAAQEAGIQPPALLVIGPVVTLSEEIATASRRPLAGRRVVLLGTAARFAPALDRAGAEVVALPLPMGEAGRTVLDAAPVTDVVLACPEHVSQVREKTALYGATAWCLGEGTARAGQDLLGARARRTEGPDLESDLVKASMTETELP